MISYGGYSFNHPYPMVAMEEETVFLSGAIDHTRMNISLVGELTGCSLQSLKIQKDLLVHAFSSGFQNLELGNTGYEFCKPIQINFAGSNLRRILPYEILLEGYHQKSFSQFFGISSPVDVWNFSEEEGRIVSATHSVSAIGLKTDTGDSLLRARDFVTGRLRGFNNDLSLFFSGQTAILNSREESINRMANSYGMNEIYSLSTSTSNLDTSGAIVRADCQMSYSKDGDLSVSVNGSIKGGMLTGVHTGYFSPLHAKEFAKNAIVRAKLPYENTLYGDIVKDPLTYNYDVNTGANSIDFSFIFADPTDTRTGDVIHDYSSSINASKDNGFVSLSIDGVVKYNSNKDIFITAAPESETRYIKVEQFFSGIDPFAIAQQHFLWFDAYNLPYSHLPLNDSFVQFNINKTPHQSEISYNYEYSNKPDFFSGLFSESSTTIDTEWPIDTYSVQPTTDGSFSVQGLFKTLTKRGVSFNGTLNTGVNIQAAINIASGWISQYSGQGGTLVSNSLETGNNRLSINTQFTF